MAGNESVVAIVTVSSPWGELHSGESYHRLWLDLLQAKTSSSSSSATKSSWKLHNAYDGDVPSMEQLDKDGVAALCVVGVDCGTNQWSALRTKPWAADLLRLVTDFLRLNESTSDGNPGSERAGEPVNADGRRVFCCGLGSHVVAEAIGCTIESNPVSSEAREVGESKGEQTKAAGDGEGESVPHPFIVEATAVRASPGFVGTIAAWLRKTRANSLSPPPRVFTDAAAKDLNFATTAFLLESHSEQVTRLPQSCSVLASSDRTMAEIWTFEDRVLAFQCHPELTPALIKGRVLPKLQAAPLGKFSVEEASAALDGALDSDALAAMARHFIAGSPVVDPLDGASAMSPGFATPLSATNLSPLLHDKLRLGDLGREEIRGVMATAKTIFESIAQAIKGEFKIPQMEYNLLGKMNKTAAEKYSHMADFTAGLAVFVESLRDKEESLGPLASQIDDLESQLEELENLVAQLDEYSKRLENRIKKYVFS